MKSKQMKTERRSRGSDACRLFLLTLLALIIVAAVVSCAEDPEVTSEQTDASQTSVTQQGGDLSETSSTLNTTEPQTPETEPERISIEIGGRDISEYTIVYARSGFYRMSKMPQYKQYMPVWDFNRESAERLAEIVSDACGVTLSVVEDESSTETDYEILIGDTSRDSVESLELSGLESDSYRILSSGSKLVICGGEYGTTWHALDYVEQLVADALETEEKSLEFGSDYSYDGEYHLFRIGTIGDSITQGVGASSATYLSYPAQMGRYLWKDALVYNFGNSGKTMRSDLADAYTKTQTYTDVLNAASELDIVTIMLGTNDSNRDRNWTALSSTSFNNSCKQIFAALYERNDELKFVLANCPAYFGTDGFGSTTVRLLQQALPEELNSLGYDTEFFDMFSVTEDMRSYYPDLLHPNDMGHMLMAESFSSYLAELILSMASEE